MVLGHEMVLDGQDNLALSVVGYHERMITSLIQQIVRPGDIVVDIGAHIGYYTLLLARSVGVSGHVYAFEPDVDNFSLLKENVGRNGYERSVTIEQMAIADTPGTVALYHSTSTGDHRIYDSGNDRERTLTQASTLDTYFCNQERINFIKMDIQGAEALALRGSSRTLARNQDVQMITEFWPFGLMMAGTDPDDYVQSLEQLGFHLHLIDNARGTKEAVGSAGLIGKYDKYLDNWSGDLYCTR